MKKMFETIEGKIAFAIVIIVVLAFNWLRPVKHEVRIPLTKSVWENEYREYDTREYGDWYVGGTKLGETRVHDIHGNYVGSVLNDPELSTKYYWWIPRESMQYETALDDLAVDAVWKNSKFIDMFGTEFIVGCETFDSNY